MVCPCALAQSAQPEPRSHARLLFRGDLDSDETKRAFLSGLEKLDEVGAGTILIELTGNRARPDLLFDVLRAVRDAKSPLVVHLQDDADREVGPGQLAIALAAESASISPRTRVVRTIDDDLTALNPEIEDWSVIGLDLRHAVEQIAMARSIPQAWLEALVAPRSGLWAIEDAQGQLRLVDEGSGDARPVVTRTEAGWTFDFDASSAARLYGLGLNRSTRTLANALSLRGRPVETIEIDSGLISAHVRCGTLIREVRVAIRLADAALDIRGNRRGSETLMPRDYRTAADKAAGLVEECRGAIAEVEALTTTYPEILCMTPPADEDAPTEIGGPAVSSLTAWRDAVHDAERDLARVDDRIADYRRR
ncbi:MAG: hypothetical protein H6810_11285 [Phycisphaeraceae bacterium]|nr:MAG: hypothetical protein H6810_11285 [Phycisphaeraceae bacterium]